MSDLASDRRRVPRAVIADTELSVLAFPIPVRLLDISLAGVLLERFTIGASFVALSRQDQRVIERFADQ
jgi:hypothetical protein